MNETILDYSTNNYNFDTKFILYDDTRFGILIFDKPLNDETRDKVYKYFREIGLDPFKVSFISSRAYYANCKLYERS